METIVNYLEKHPMITYGSIEKALGLTNGTLRKGKPISKKLINPIKNLLKYLIKSPMFNILGLEIRD